MNGSYGIKLYTFYYILSKDDTLLKDYLYVLLHLPIITLANHSRKRFIKYIPNVKLTLAYVDNLIPEIINRLIMNYNTISQ